MRTKFICNAIAIALLIILLLSTLSLPVFAKTTSLPDLPDYSTAKAVYLYNFESDRAIVSKNAGERIAPASTVKIATGLLAIETLSSRLDERITVSADMLSSVGGASLGLRTGDVLSIRDLLYASICGGYNDATEILAHLAAGSSETFVARLNARVRELGCTETVYKNPTGIDASGAYTTLNDVVMLSKAALDSPLYMTVSSAISYSFTLKNSERSILIYNRNALISPYYYQGCQSKYTRGLIAGMTDKGGHCVATYAEYAGSRYLCVVMGAHGASEGLPNSFAIAFRLLQHCFLNLVYTPIAQKGEIMCEAPVRLALPKDKEGMATIPCVLEKDLFALLPEDTKAESLTFRPYLHYDSLEAPVAKGSIVGGVDVYYGETWICHERLIAGADMEAHTALTLLDGMKRLLISRRSIIAISALLIMTAVYLPLSLRTRKKASVYLDFRTDSRGEGKKPPKR